MIENFFKNMMKKSIGIPYEDSLVYPTTSIAMNAIANYCGQEKLEYEFMGKNDEDNMLVKIDGVCYEVLRGLAGKGGYGISCRPV